MTRAEETARVAALRAAFAASDEPCPFRWFARQQDQQSVAEPARDRTDHAWDVIADMESF